jgi:hypothetical protein
MYVVLAREGDHLFDRAYASNMKLPFNQGWDKWEVYTQSDSSRDLHFVEEFKSYQEVEAFLRARPIDFHPVPTGIFQ